MGTSGKLTLIDEIRKFKEEIREYYGLKNELQMGVRSSLPPKPEIIVFYEETQLFNLPFVDGGYIDQPYLYCIYYKVAKTTIETMEYINELASRNTKG